MAQEPWCYHPEQIATLTDWQVMYLYLKPASDRAEEMRKQMEKDRPKTPGMPSEPGLPFSADVPMPSLEQVLDAAERLGIDLNKAREGYEMAARKK
jgi:hypothetical protein